MPTLNLASKLTIHYLDFNPQGRKTVLLLHGLGVTGSSWQLQIKPLVEAGFRVLAPDLRGFGQSTYPGGRVSIADMASDMVALLQSLQTGPTHVVGISMGGTHALQIALDAPNLVDRLVLVNTFARLQPDRLAGWLYFSLRFLMVHTLGLSAQAHHVAQHLFPHPDQEELRQVLMDQISQANPQGYRATMWALGLFDVRKRLSEIHKPTLVVSAENDKTVTLHNQRILVDRIPGARHAIISQAGHAVIIDQPKQFNRLLLNFLTVL